MAEPRVGLRADKASSGSNLPVRRIVVHATCGGTGYPRESAAGRALDTAEYFQTDAATGSAHYVCDIATEQHTLPDAVVAWHAPPNQHSLGIEICADGGEKYGKFVPYTRDQWLSPQVWPAVERAARRVRELADRHNVPLRRLTVAQVKAGSAGICGHVDVSQAFRQSDHTDPGPTFPWDHFMAAVLNTPIEPPPTTTTPCPAAPPYPGHLLAVGVTGAAVRQWQQKMADRGWHIAVDGVYGPASAAVCRAFQQEKGLDVDGVVGPDTWRTTWEAPVT